MKQFNSFLSGFFASTASLLGKMITADSLLVRNSYQNRKIQSFFIIIIVWIVTYFLNAEQITVGFVFEFSQCSLRCLVQNINTLLSKENMTAITKVQRNANFELQT